MTLGELMQHVLRLQVEVDELCDMINQFADWRDDVPGCNREVCPDMADSIAFSLLMLRDNFSAEIQAATREPIADAGE